MNEELIRELLAGGGDMVENAAAVWILYNQIGVAVCAFLAGGLATLATWFWRTEQIDDWDSRAAGFALAAGFAVIATGIGIDCFAAWHAWKVAPLYKALEGLL
jgi:hypothetical protein